MIIAAENHLTVTVVPFARTDRYCLANPTSPLLIHAFFAIAVSKPESSDIEWRD